MSWAAITIRSVWRSTPALALVAAANSARAQDARPPQHAAPTWQAWGSLALGPGASNGETQLAGDISVWVTRDQLAFSVRDAGVSRFLETGDVVDISVLAGFHPRSEAHLDFVIAGGLGISRGHHIGGAVLSTAPVAAFNTQLNLNYRVVGAALDGFAAVGPSRSYYGVGLALALGWFR